MTATIEAPTMNPQLAEIAAAKGVTFTPVRVMDGVGRQIIVVHKDGYRDRRLAYRGTLDQAQAKAILDHSHDTLPEWPVLMAILRGE